MYAILSVQLILTFGIVAIFTWVDEVKQFAYDNQAMFWAAFGLTIAMIILLACCSNFRRKTPWNYIALLVFTLCEGYLLGCCSATFDADEVAIAVVATVIVTLALTAFAFQVRIVTLPELGFKHGLQVFFLSKQNHFHTKYLLPKYYYQVACKGILLKMNN